MPPGAHVGQVRGVAPYKLCHRRALREPVVGAPCFAVAICVPWDLKGTPALI